MLAPVNGNLLNGGRFALVLATATIACSAALAAQAISIQDALAPTPATGSFVAVPTYIHHTGAAFGSVGEVHPTVTHTQSAGADITGSVNFRGLVTRSVKGTASFAGYVNVLAIPTSVLGQATVSPASATVLVNATKIQHGRSALENTATVTLQATPQVNRVVVADVMGASAQLYAESAINKVGEAYAYFAAAGNLQSNSVGLVTRPAGATLFSSGEVTANATHVKHSQATYVSGGYTIVSEPYLAIGGLAFLTTHAEVTAVAIQQALGSAVVAGSANLISKSLIAHGSTKAYVQGSAEVSGATVRTTSAQATQGGASQFAVFATRNTVPQVDALVEAFFAATAVRTAPGETQILESTANVVALSDVTVREAAAAVACMVDVGSLPLITRYVSAECGAIAEQVAAPTRMVLAETTFGADGQVSAQAVRVGMGTANLVAEARLLGTPDITQRNGAAVIVSAAEMLVGATAFRMVAAWFDVLAATDAVADRSVYASAALDCMTHLTITPITNPLSYDPDERTFFRPAQVVDFVRPSQITEFRRLA